MRYCIVDIMKVIACLLIVNFHSDILFPENIRVLAFGGDLGNNIFFLVSGFVLWPSIQKSIQTGNGWTWYKRRFMRIFPMLFCFNVVMLAVWDFKLSTVKEAISYLVFPTNYWFATAILLFYALLYLIEKTVNNRFMRLACLIPMIALHLFYNDSFAERYIVGFAAILIGCELHRSIMILYYEKIKNSFFGGCTVATAGVYCILKLLRSRGIECYGLTLLGVGITTILLAYVILLWGLARNKELMELFVRTPWASHCVLWVSEATLAIYLINVMYDRFLTRLMMSSFRFPVSYVLNLVITILVARLVTILNNHVSKLPEFRLN